jgi:hypothetical protein
MKKSFWVCFAVLALGAGAGLWAQFTAEDMTAYDKWEDFLKTAKVVAQEQLTGPLAVTNPWILTLEKQYEKVNDKGENEAVTVRHKAVWKDILGERVGGFKETWKGEIAAYRLNRLLGLNMVPVTVEREFRGDRGSCQLWIEGWNTMETILKKKLNPPGIKAMYFARDLCLQRAFDNLIYNVDRHQRNYLIMEDWRMILIDHSRSFGTSKKACSDLIYDEKYKEGPNFIMATLPRAFFEALKALTPESVRTAVGEYLTDQEIACLMSRRDLIVAWVDKRIKDQGEAKVLY